MAPVFRENNGERDLSADGLRGRFAGILRSSCKSNPVMLALLKVCLLCVDGIGAVFATQRYPITQRGPDRARGGFGTVLDEETKH